jgi:hypothetical protein
MNPFECELIKCKDGKKKVRIIEETDENKKLKREKVTVKEEVLKRIIMELFQCNEIEIYEEEGTAQPIRGNLSFI